MKLSINGRCYYFLAPARFFLYGHSIHWILVGKKLNLISRQFKEKGEMSWLTGTLKEELVSGSQSSAHSALPFILSRGTGWPSVMEWRGWGMWTKTILALHHLKKLAECMSSTVIDGLST